MKNYNLISNRNFEFCSRREKLTEFGWVKPDWFFSEFSFNIMLCCFILNCLVRSAFQASDQPGSFKCARVRCKTCPFSRNVQKISAPKRSIKITDHFTCTSSNVMHCVTCSLCKKLFIGETSRRLGDRFREDLRDVEKEDKSASKPVARHVLSPQYF